MKSIIRIHEKILDHIIEIRNEEPSFYFVPRKINNKKRLDNGYYFLGNDWYCNVSFWKGTDWKEKINNIGFVVLGDKKSFIEFSAQDSKLKAGFLEKVAKEIGGFKKAENKDKWFYHFEGQDYIANLTYFINEVKPKIEALVEKYKPDGISLLDKEFYKRYCSEIVSRRVDQIEFGKKNKIVRVAWNTNNWRSPSGSLGKSNSEDAHENKYGYGHEEWMFDKSKIFNDYKYGFLEPLRLKSDIHVDKVYNISLYTKNNNGKKYYVGRIKNAICIGKDESKQAFDNSKRIGEIDLMREDIKKVGGNVSSLIFSTPEEFYNVKFKLSDIEYGGELFEISEDDNNITTSRFKLLSQKNEISITEDKEVVSLSAGNLQNTKKRKRVYSVESEYEPYHAIMQNVLKGILDLDESYKFVQIEKGRVDLKAITHDDEMHYFELKTDSPKLSIRKAIGQVMEYAFYPNIKRADKLIVVSDAVPDDDTIKYLNFIRENFSIPIVYKSLNVSDSKLSEEY